MDIYQQKSKWKIGLAVIGIFIIAASYLYTDFLTGKLEIEERNRAEEFLDAFRSLNMANADDANFDSDAARAELNQDLRLPAMIIERNITIPIIIENEAGIIEGSKNYDEKIANDTTLLRKEIDFLKARGKEPVAVNYVAGVTYCWYSDSLNLKLLKYFPLVQFFLISAFIGLGYLGFSLSRTAEQNQVWAGMAKETAHQLGTPISAILGWIEHLKVMHAEDDSSMDLLAEFRKDVTRLELIADRFSKIGSAPELERKNIYVVLDEVFDYMKRRAPRKVQFEKIPHGDPIFVRINEHLFEWVIENILRNAIDALDGEGEIIGKVEVDSNEVAILVTDTGKGIPASKFKTVFQPGFTTKKRGWGLGLSLAKRIIESYHSGKIFVKSSVAHEGTTFVVKLPRA